MTVPVGFSRRELFVDARDIQAKDEYGQYLTQEEYEQLVLTRGEEKLNECQVVQSFDATIRTQKPTYKYGTDFQLGDIITVTDERLGITCDAVVEGRRCIITKDEENVSFIFGYGQPTLTEILRRKAGR